MAGSTRSYQISKKMKRGKKYSNIRFENGNNEVEEIEQRRANKV